VGAIIKGLPIRGAVIRLLRIHPDRQLACGAPLVSRCCSPRPCSSCGSPCSDPERSALPVQSRSRRGLRANYLDGIWRCALQPDRPVSKAALPAPGRSAGHARVAVNVSNKATMGGCLWCSDLAAALGDDQCRRDHVTSVYGDIYIYALARISRHSRLVARSKRQLGLPTNLVQTQCRAACLCNQGIHINSWCSTIRVRGARAVVVRRVIVSNLTAG